MRTSYIKIYGGLLLVALVVVFVAVTADGCESDKRARAECERRVGYVYYCAYKSGCVCVQGEYPEH